MPPSDRSWYAKTKSGWLARAFWHPTKKAFRAAASSTSGGSEPISLKTCANAEPPRRVFLFARSKRIKTVSSAISLRSCGVHVLSVALTGANAVILRDKGPLTSTCSPSSHHFMDIDMESFPTGMPMPKAGHNSIPIACTASYRLEPSPAFEAAHIQLALSFTRERLSTEAAARLVRASATASLAEAAAFNKATGGRSPIAIASPVATSKP